jgi:DNA-binding transcriptional LysR family regulator
VQSDNWDDLRFALAVIDAGSVAGAARRLGVSHATVLRRVAAFETRAGAGLFCRTPQGYTPREDRAEAIAALREAAAALTRVRHLTGHGPANGAASPRPVRVTSTDTFCHVVLPPIAAGLARGADPLRIELISANGHLDFARLEADLTVRPAAELPAALTGRAVARLGFAVYAAPGVTGPWLGLSGPLARSRAADWLAARVPPQDQGAASDSFLALRAMAVEGMGRAVLPCVLGDGEPRLERQGGPIGDAAVPIWVAAPAALAGEARIARAAERIGARLEAEGPRLDGTLIGAA